MPALVTILAVTMASIQLRALKLFFSSAYLWRRMARPEISKIDLVMDRLARTQIAGKAQYESQEIGGVLCRVLNGDRIHQRVILYLHGGGFSFGSINTHFAFVEFLSRMANACVVFPEYSRTPQKLFPAQLNECAAVYDFIVHEFHSSLVYLAGDSAGGNLACSLAMKLNDENKRLPDKLVALSPWLDLSEEGIRSIKQKRDVVFSKDEILKYARLYTGNQDPHQRYLSPAFGNFPASLRAMFLLDKKEMFWQSIDTFCRRSIEDGCNMTLVQRNGYFHAWPLFVGMMPEADCDAKLIAGFLNQ